MTYRFLALVAEALMVAVYLMVVVFIIGIAAIVLIMKELSPQSNANSVPDSVPLPPTSGNYHMGSGSQFIDALAEGIARAEGYYAPGSHDGHSLAYFSNNPGDISDNGTGETGKNGNGLNIYPDPETGWQALYHKLTRMLNGQSRTYRSSFSVAQLATVWTGGDNPGPWASNVVAHLQQAGYEVSPQSTIGEMSAYA